LRDVLGINDWQTLNLLAVSEGYAKSRPQGRTTAQTIAAFYLAHELVFTRNKLIVFTTSRELSHYVVFSRIMVERKVGVVLKSIVFSSYVYIPLFLRILSLHILCLKNERNIPFDLIKNTYLHLH